MPAFLFRRMSMAKTYVKFMDVLYFICVFIAGGALVDFLPYAVFN